MFNKPLVSSAVLCLVAAASLLVSGDEPRFAISRMGLYDELHTRNDGYQESSLQDTTPTGFAAGYSVRFDNDSNAGESAWIYDASSGKSTRIGLVDPDGNERWSSYPTFLNRKGQVAGTSRWTPASSNDQWCWFYDYQSKSQTQIGFFDAQHTRSNGQQTTEVQALTESGHAFGNSMRFDGSAYQGRSVWAFDSKTSSHTRIGLWGGDYTHASSGEEESGFSQTNSQGYAAGWSRLWTNNTFVTWSYNPSTSTVRRIGMNGPGGGGPWDNGNDSVLGITENRRVIGQYHQDSQHQAIWVHNDATNTTTRTGLTDAEHTSPSQGRQYSYDVKWNSKGQVIGAAYRYPNLDDRRKGRSAWMFDPETSATQRLGFTDAEHTTTTGNYQNSWAQEINESGMVIGGSERLAVPEGRTNGRTAWLYDPSDGTTTKLGHRSAIPGTNDYHHNTAVALNNRGQVVGEAQQTAGYAGNTLWMYDSETDVTRSIGLFDATHTHATENYQYAMLSVLTDTGLVAGASRRIGIGASAGQTAWLYDWDTDLTKTLIFSQNEDGHADSVVKSISDSGIVIGQYRLYEGDPDDEIYRSFIGTLGEGFYDLEGLVDDGLLSHGWLDLEGDLFDLGQAGQGALGALGGEDGKLQLNRFAGMGYRLDGSYLPYAITAVPEPSSFVLCVIALLGCIGYGWRRRISLQSRSASS